MIKCKYYVYLIKSEICNRYYVGYTNNIFKRLRAHNGEISGGAKKTRKYRPWKYVLYISGFEYERTALQYEFCIYKYYKNLKSLRTKDHAFCKTKNLRTNDSSSYRGLEKWIYIMHSLITRERICSTAVLNKENRYIIFFHDSNTQKIWNKFNTNIEK